VPGATTFRRLVLSSFQKEEKNPLKGSGCHVFLWGYLLYKDSIQMCQVQSREWGTLLGQVEVRWRLLSQEFRKHHPQNIPDQARQSLNKFSQEHARCWELPNSRQQGLRCSVLPTCQLQVSLPCKLPADPEWPHLPCELTRAHPATCHQQLRAVL